jgi:glycosyltransferase involved in cell wall biosynthesis
MRITIVIGPFYPTPPGPAGSVEKIWTRLAEEFASQGHSVTVVSRTYDGLPRRELRKGVEFVRKTSFSRTGSRFGDLLLEMCYALALLPSLPRADVIITNTIFLPILTGLMRKRFGATVVSVERFPKEQLGWYSQCARLRTTSYAVDRAARLQAPRLTDKIVRVPNPVDLAVFAPPTVPRGDAREGKIIYAGRIHPEKGLEALVNAFRLVNAKLPNVQLVMIGQQDVGRGGGGPEYVESLRALSGQLPVTLLPNTDSPIELADHLRKGNIFCYPSIAEKGESFPVAPLEAMATGLPCVLSRLPVFEDLLIEGETGFYFDHRSKDAAVELAGKLELLILNDALRQQMAHNCTVKASEYGYPSVAEAFLSDFKSLVPRR